MIAGDATSPPPFRLLMMCTANQCRSPMAEAIAAAQLAERGVDAVVASCGVLPGGVPPSAGAVRAMKRRGLDISTHLSHQLDSVTLDAADLIITMERRHLTTIAELSVVAVERGFTLVELDDLAATVGVRPPGCTTGEWIERINRMRHPSSVLAFDTDADIEDPMGGPSRAYRRTADLIEHRLSSVVDHLFPDQTDT